MRVGSPDDGLPGDPTSLPGLFLERLQRIVPSEAWPAVLASFQSEKRVAFRVNTLKPSSEDAVEELRTAGIDCQPVDWLPVAWVAPATDREKLTRHAAVLRGDVYVHNLSSMAATWALAPQPGETVMDLAAAPGGKTLHMAAEMQREGFLSAVEAVHSRFFKLKENLRRGGAEHVRTYHLDGRRVPSKTGARFDRVLLDAPCSGEARFHQSDPDSFARWSVRKIRECRAKQVGLLKAGLASVKPGGRLLYCTCSFAPEENESVVAEALRVTERPWQIEPLSLPFSQWQPGLTSWENHDFGSALEGTRRILPDHTHDGLFMALLQSQETH